MLACMSTHHCLPVTPGTDGVCLAEKPSAAGAALVSMEQMTGKWCRAVQISVLCVFSGNGILPRATCRFTKLVNLQSRFFAYSSIFTVQGSFGRGWTRFASGFGSCMRWWHFLA